VSLTGPIFSLAVAAQATAYQVFVNGALVTMDLTRRGGVERHSVNHLMQSGDNHLAVVLLTEKQPGVPPVEWRLDPAAHVHLRLAVHDPRHEGAPAVPVTTMEGRAVGEGEAISTTSSAPAGTLLIERPAEPVPWKIEVGEAAVTRPLATPTLQVARTVRVALPFGRWAFLDSDCFVPKRAAGQAEISRLYHELLSAYGQLWERAHRKDLTGLLDLFAERSAERDEAFYLPSGTTQLQLRAELERALHDPALALAPIEPDGERRHWSIETGPGSNLAFLYRTRRGGGILRFAAEGGDRSLDFPISFRRRAGRYIVAR
jgi:hypothetical protein